MEPEQHKAEIIRKYRETPEGRAKLATACFQPAQIAMEVATNDPTQVAAVDRVLSQMEQFQGYMTGEEEYDKRKFASLLESLKTLSDEIHGKVVFKRL
jgi:hypothetical protein